MKKTLIRSEMLNNKSPAPAGFYFMTKNKNNHFYQDKISTNGALIKS